ncbi:MAG: ABC transporter permease [Armatimonadota bacterium]|nr:ABC transporter permease [Armatimonadota bacterium]MDR7567987.1 ABC transporter permease [Armatimonadota bacterium]
MRTPRRLPGIRSANWMGWLVFLGFVGAWEILSRRSGSLYFPTVTRIVETFAAVWQLPNLSAHVVPSLVRMGEGYGLAALTGTVLGIAMGHWRRLDRFLEPLVEFLRATPPPALIPFALLTMGIGDASKVFVIAFSSLWPILLNARDGVRNVDQAMIETARMFGLKAREVAMRVVAPATMPQLFAGLRTSLGVAFITMVIAEMVGSTNGLGYFILNAQRLFAVPEMYAGIFLLGLLGYLVNVAFECVEGRVLSWHRGSRAVQP